MTKKKRRPGNPRITEIGVKTRFKPGQSGNPSGRPKTRILAEMLAAIGNEIEPKTGKAFFQLAAEALVKQIFRGNVHAFREFADRVDGRSTQNVELAGNLSVPPKSSWEQEYETAGPERREQLLTELDDRILAAAAEITRRRNRPAHEIEYEKRMQEYHRRVAAGEKPEDVTADSQTRPPIIFPVN